MQNVRWPCFFVNIFHQTKFHWPLSKVEEVSPSGGGVGGGGC